MSPILRAGAYLVLKAERAQTHLDALNRHVGVFLQEPYTVSRQDDAQSGRHIKRYKFKAFEPELGMVLGEFLYCLRSGLDQMAWQLALPNARRDNPRDISFPIFSDITKPKDATRYRKSLDLFPADVAKEIDALQPQKGPDPPENHALWQLNKLCNLDKHCLIPIHSRGAPVYCPHIPGAIAYSIDLEDAVEVSVPIEDKAQLDFEPDNTSEVQIGESESDWALPVQRLSEIHGFITATIIPTFLKFNLAAMPEQEVRIDRIGIVHRKKET